MSADAYLAARAVFSDIQTELEQIADFLGKISECLKRAPNRLAFSNQPIGLPMEATMSGDSVVIDAQKWPTVEVIMRLLERYHSRRRDLENTWAAIPDNIRGGLKPPENLAQLRAKGHIL